MTEAEQASFGELQKEITAALVQTTKDVGLLANEDLAFIRTSNPNLSKALDKQKSRLLTTVRRLVRCAVKDTELTAPALTKEEDVDDSWRGIVEIIDNLLEKADRCLDEFSGVVQKSMVPEPTETNQSRSKPIARAENIPKPQLQFLNPPQNNLTTPFKPLLRAKPHAVITLEDSIASENQDGSDRGLRSESFGHPYAHEIKNYRYPARVYSPSEPIPSQPYSDTEAVWVDTMEGVHSMLAELRQAKEIAIDLEHHDTRTYVGLVSLMQISTREKDWIVDTLKPWREELQILNEVFANPNIVKVLHGAQMDIIWLQRDLGLYLVGLFDTYYAARNLGYVRHSLAFLLNKFVNFDAQKQYQLADWRTRPLSDEMFNYARSDTHFLLYIYDNMKNELLSKANGGPALVDDVLEESKKTALQRYERSVYDPELGLGDRGWYQMLVRTPAAFNKEQFSAFKAVHQWRDQLARKEDESPVYLISNSTLFNIARDLPSTIPNLQSHFQRKLDIVTSRISELLKVIQEAKDRATDGPEMNDFMSKHPALPDYLAKKAARKEAFAARAAAEQQVRSVAEIANQEIHSISGENLKASESVFWGSTMHGHKRRRLDTPSSVVSFQVPLPDLTAEVFAVDGEDLADDTKPAPLPQHAYIKSSRNNDVDDAEEGEEVFTLKEQGGPRKRKHKDTEARNDITQGEDMAMLEADSIPIEDDAIDRIRDKKQRKLEKKEAKREQRLSQLANGKGHIPDNAGSLEVFDYANAPSVLHAKHEATEGSKGKHRAPVLNPYAKSMDAPKGLPKKKKDIQGKSATFKT